MQVFLIYAKIVLNLIPIGLFDMIPHYITVIFWLAERALLNTTLTYLLVRVVKIKATFARLFRWLGLPR